MRDVSYAVKGAGAYAARVIVSATVLAAVCSALDVVLAWVCRWKYPVPAFSPIVKLYVASLDFCVVLVPLGAAVALLISGRRVLKALGGVILGAGLALYLVSWSSYVMAGYFLNVEGLRFLALNFLQILPQVAETSVPAVLTFFFCLGAAVLAVPPACRGIIALDKAWRQAHLPVLSCGVVTLVMAVLVGMAVSGVEASLDVSKGLSRYFSPALTIVRDMLTVRRDIPSPVDSPLRIRRDVQIPMRQYLAQSRSPAAAGPVIVIVIESLRNDVLGDGTIMPNLFALKQDSLSFAHTLAVSNRTDASWPSIFSSQYPLRSRAHYYYPRTIPFPKVFIYDVLKQYNYATAVFSAQNENWGYIRNYMAGNGLDVYFDSNATPFHQYVDPRDNVFLKWASSRRAALKIDDAAIVDEALPWAERGGGAFFIGMFFQRPHFPYTWPDFYKPPVAAAKAGYNVIFSNYPRDLVPLMKRRYYNALSYVDVQIGRIIAFLKSRGLYDQSVIIVTGDHGESFYEKQFCCHGNYLFQEEALTEMVIKTPAGRSKGARQEWVSNLDIPPTICGLLGIRPHPAFQGMDITRAGSDTHRPLFASINTNIADQDAVYLDGWKYIREYTNREEFLFDVVHDPAERENLAAARPDVADALRRQVLHWRRAQLEYYSNLVMEKTQYPPKFESGRI